MIYIILPVHNRINETKKFISCLKEQSYKDYHLILVDDGCTDGTADYVEKEIQSLTILRGNGNLWWAGSLEKAKKHLFTRQNNNNEDVVLIANDDISFNKDFLKNILQDLKGNPGAIILAQCHERDTGKVLDRGVVVDWKRLQFLQAEDASEINVLSTRGLYMTIDVFRRVGRFHPILLPHYASDYEYTHRAYKKGIQLRVSSHTKLYGNMKTTGIRNVDYRIKFLTLLNNLFISKRSVYNRIMWTNFILLSCEPRYILQNIIKIHLGTLGILAKWTFHLLKKYRIRFLVLYERITGRKLKIIIGSGGIRQKGWIATDIPQLDITQEKNWRQFFVPDSIDAINAEHVWEHLTDDDARLAEKNCWLFLKRGGHIRIAVPEGYFHDKKYIEEVRPMGTGSGAEDHKNLYTYKTLPEGLAAVGFKVKLLEYWDENGVFHYEPWDVDDGLIRRSKNHDPRNRDGKLRYTSLIMDATKQ